MSLMVKDLFCLVSVFFINDGSENSCDFGVLGEQVVSESFNSTILVDLHPF